MDDFLTALHEELADKGYRPREHCEWLFILTEMAWAADKSRYLLGYDPDTARYIYAAGNSSDHHFERITKEKLKPFFL